MVLVDYTITDTYTQVGASAALGAPPPAQPVIRATLKHALVQLGIYISCLVSHNSAKQTETLPLSLLPR